MFGGDFIFGVQEAATTTEEAPATLARPRRPDDTIHGSASVPLTPLAALATRFTGSDFPFDAFDVHGVCGHLLCLMSTGYLVIVDAFDLEGVSGYLMRMFTGLVTGPFFSSFVS